VEASRRFRACATIDAPEQEEGGKPVARMVVYDAVIH